MPKIHWFSLRDHLWRNGFSMNLWRRHHTRAVWSPLPTLSSQCSAFKEPEMYAIPPPIPGRAELFKHQQKTCSWQVLPSALDGLVNFQEARLSLTPMYRWLGTWKVRRIRFTPCKSTKVKHLPWLQGIYFTHVWRGMLWKYSRLLPYQFEAAKSIRFISEKIQSALQVGRSVYLSILINCLSICQCIWLFISICLPEKVCEKNGSSTIIPYDTYDSHPRVPKRDAFGLF